MSVVPKTRDIYRKCGISGRMCILNDLRNLINLQQNKFERKEKSPLKAFNGRKELEEEKNVEKDTGGYCKIDRNIN